MLRPAETIEALSVILTVLGAAWAGMRAYFGLQIKLEQAKVESAEKAIAKVESVIDRITQKMSEMEEKSYQQYSDMSEKLGEIKLTLNNVMYNIDARQASIEQAYQGISNALVRVVDKSGKHSWVLDLGKVAVKGK